MGRTSTPTFRVEHTTAGSVRHTNSNWRPAYGRPTVDNLRRYVQELNASFEPGGANAHIGQRYGAAARVTSARIVRQSTGAVMAEVTL